MPDGFLCSCSLLVMRPCDRITLSSSSVVFCVVSFPSISVEGDVHNALGKGKGEVIEGEGGGGRRSEGEKGEEGGRETNKQTAEREKLTER